MKPVRAIVGPLLALLVVGTSLPGAEAATYRYVASGAGLGCHDDPLTGTDGICFGRIALPVEPLTHIVFVPQDVAWGQNAGYGVCFKDSGTHGCVSSSYGCGPSATVAPIEATRVIVHFWPLLVDPDLNVCGATTGTVTV